MTAARTAGCTMWGACPEFRRISVGVELAFRLTATVAVEDGASESVSQLDSVQAAEQPTLQLRSDGKGEPGAAVKGRPRWNNPASLLGTAPGCETDSSVP